MDIYEEAQGVLAVITEQSLPKTKKAIAGKFNEDDCEADIRYVFPQVFVKKALFAIRVFLKSLSDEVSGDIVGVKVPRFGIYSDKDIHTMDRWHTAMEYVADTKQAIDWVQNTDSSGLESQWNFKMVSATFKPIGKR
ncbi:hypothetical protein P3T76_012693 [Phytophthora citrophthora]|uniref:Uncharacterized protein n=1 Tax=Phytophthora citrophthora TaxID=4793 RepID=A0AAD9LCU6_9STRA|nr:hypothetical protein P3T76_012693 [Phytophthora citrophthora]